MWNNLYRIESTGIYEYLLAHIKKSKKKNTISKKERFRKARHPAQKEKVIQTKFFTDLVLSNRKIGSLLRNQ
jgi:hypothetical protein